MSSSLTTRALLDLLEVLQSRSYVADARVEAPNYWHGEPRTLSSTADIRGIAFGAGHQIYRHAIFPVIEQAESEVILVTCFWARSATLDELSTTLRKLSAKAQQSGSTIRVRICFSSCSVWQKLFQTSSLNGQTWPASKWRSRLGLPPSDELPGLELKVKSIFQLPFSVMHPKFVVVDRKVVLLPSCNVSWEDWFEGCVTLSGPVVHSFVDFWQNFWADNGDGDCPAIDPGHDLVEAQVTESPLSSGLLSSAHIEGREIPAVLLPSPHHRFSLPWLTSETPPTTPLNIYLFSLLRRAQHHIYIQTPNLTVNAVLSELMKALERGIDVTIVTSRKLMRLEQIVTAGTTTARCVESLIKRYEKLVQRSVSANPSALEAGLVQKNVGRLVVRYHESRPSTSRAQHEPVQSHLKLTIVDDKVAVFGSGNLDRASWFTSQELGLALASEALVHQVQGNLSTAMEGRSTLEYDSLESK